MSDFWSDFNGSVADVRAAGEEMDTKIDELDARVRELEELVEKIGDERDDWMNQFEELQEEVSK